MARGVCRRQLASRRRHDNDRQRGRDAQRARQSAGRRQQDVRPRRFPAITEDEAYELDTLLTQNTLRELHGHATPTLPQSVALFLKTIRRARSQQARQAT